MISFLVVLGALVAFYWGARWVVRRPEPPSEAVRRQIRREMRREGIRRRRGW